jgi:hypothetical protein
VVTAGAVREATWRGPGADIAFSFVNAFGLAAVTAHLLGWPRRRGALGLPWLTDCEGLGAELMRWYNPLLYIPGAVAAVALATENRSASRWPAIAAVAALVPALVHLQRLDFDSRQRRAEIHPDRWHRRLVGADPVTATASVWRPTRLGTRTD